MPIYQYRCDVCKEEIDVLCKYEDDDHRCRVCKTRLTRQLSNPVGYVRQGTKTFYRDSKNKKE